MALSGLALKWQLLSVLFCYMLNTAANTNLAHAQQRSLNHWKHDLEYRLNLYNSQRATMDSIIGSSVDPGRQQPIDGPVRIWSAQNVRFSSLIAPTGSLVLDNHIARPTVQLLHDRTQDYLYAKIKQLEQLRYQFNSLQTQLDDPAQQFIYKGARGAQQPSYNATYLIRGYRIFKQVEFANFVGAQNLSLQHVNRTVVDKVISETYMLNPQFNLLDPQGRLFFEGKKTFWNTVFSKPLKSGCCERLKPLHTSRMMLRSTRQEVTAPILIMSNSPPTTAVAPTAIIRQLAADQMFNRGIDLNKSRRKLNLSAHVENFIQPSNLINIRQYDQPEVIKTIVFKDTLLVDEALLSNSLDHRLVIGFSSRPGFFFDLSHDNYLLKFVPYRNSTYVQHVAGALVVDAAANFLAGVHAEGVNQVSNFQRFVDEALVRIDRPAVIRGRVQFNALPTYMSLQGGSSSSRPPQNVLMMRVSRELEVRFLNGMSLPQDIVVLPIAGVFNPGELKPTHIIHVRGARHFENQLTLRGLVQVSGLVSGLQLPFGVVPLHLNDFMATTGHSNLWFVDGLSTHHLTVQSGQFDEILLREVNGDAQSLVVKSLLTTLPDGTQIIRAPMRVNNLKVTSNGPNQGLVNGFRPQDVLELSNHASDALSGRKTFLAPVEAIDCVFSDINQLTNWTNHLIRVDRPGTVQTVHRKLLFTQANQPASVNINRLKVEFYPENVPSNYERNWNFSPEFTILQHALMKAVANHTGGRYRVTSQVRMLNSRALVNNISLEDVITLDTPFRFLDKYVMVGKVEVQGLLRADRITSNYPIDVMDLVQFDRYRIPITGSRTPIRMNNLVLGPDNSAPFVQVQMLNGVPFSDYANSIMSLTKPQLIDSNLVFNAPADFEALVHTQSSLNGIKNFRGFADSLKSARYSFEDGLQCNSVYIRTLPSY